MRSNGRIKSYVPFEHVLWSYRWNAPTNIVGMQKRFHATPRKTAYEKSSKTLSAIQRSDQNLWTFLACTVVASVVRPERISSAWSRDSMLLQGKQLTETPLKIWARSNGRIKSHELFQPVLWSCWWYDPTDIVAEE